MSTRISAVPLFAVRGLDECSTKGGGRKAEENKTRV